MNNRYLVLLSLLGTAGLAAFTSGNLPQRVPAAAAPTSFISTNSPLQDTTAAVASSEKKKKKKKERKPSAARVTLKREVNRATITQNNAEGHNVEVVIMNSGVTLRNVDDMQMIGSSGSPMTSSTYMGFDNVSFPFEGNIRFKAPNKLGTVVYDREVRFVVNEPGRWTLRVDL